MITAHTQIVGLIGWPIGHSISPAMHNAAFVELELDWCYVPLPVAPARVGEAVRGVRALGLRGANVTVPHKQAVLPYLDRLTPAAQAIGAVNTLVVDDDLLEGDNTDAAGFVADLAGNGFDPADTRALVVGAGGSARAIVYGLADAGCAAIMVANRTLANAEALVEAMQPRFHDCVLSSVLFPDGIGTAAAAADLVVNCTSLGMSPHGETLPWDEDVLFAPEQTIYDLVYNPASTRLLQLAAADGARAIGGIGMLIHQGAIAFERWTGQPAPLPAMRKAANVIYDR